MAVSRRRRAKTATSQRLCAKGPYNRNGLSTSVRKCTLQATLSGYSEPGVPVCHPSTCLRRSWDFPRGIRLSDFGGERGPAIERPGMGFPSPSGMIDESYGPIVAPPDNFCGMMQAESPFLTKRHLMKRLLFSLLLVFLIAPTLVFAASTTTTHRSIIALVCTSRRRPGDGWRRSTTANASCTRM